MMRPKHQERPLHSLPSYGSLLDLLPGYALAHNKRREVECRTGRSLEKGTRRFPGLCAK